MPASIVKSKLKSGRPVLVNKSNFHNPSMVELIGLMGFDCLWLCNEHIAVDQSLMASMLQACRASGMDCVVRVGQDCYADIMRFLELGANGLMLPHITDAASLEKVIDVAKFPPLGHRGIDAVSADADFGMMPLADYLKFANEQTFIVAQIEDVTGLNNIEEIAAVKGVDVIFIGPADLSLNMGIPGQLKHPDIIDAIKRAVKVCRNNNITCGTPGLDPDHSKMLLDMGVGYITGASDYGILVRGFREAREKYRAIGFDFRDEGRKY
ncbi:MAG: HpcH/HpaI aldolase/citrate lyase family protein [Sedimentisphaeraceae bacterium JB056]